MNSFLELVISMPDVWCLPLQVGLSVVHEVSFTTISTLYHLASRVPALKKYKLQPKQETSASQIMVGGHVGTCPMDFIPWIYKCGVA